MDEAQMQQIMGFIKSAVDTAEERFGKRLDERFLEEDIQGIKADLQTFKGDMSSEFFAVKRKLESMGEDIEEIRKFSASGINTALGEAFDQGGKAADIFKVMRRTQKDHEKRITSLEQVKG